MMNARRHMLLYHRNITKERCQKDSSVFSEEEYDVGDISLYISLRRQTTREIDNWKSFSQIQYANMA